MNQTDVDKYIAITLQNFIGSRAVDQISFPVVRMRNQKLIHQRLTSLGESIKTYVNGNTHGDQVGL